MKQRILTAIAAGLFFVLFVIIGNLPFITLVTGLAIIGYYELLKMKKIHPLSFPGLIGFLLVIVLVIPNGLIENMNFSLTSIEFFMIGLLLLLIFTVWSKNAFHFDNAGFILLSVLYVGFGFHYFIVARELENGFTLVFFILLLNWASDSAAYFTGRSIGKRKLWPQISPKKTIEGAIGGIVAAVIVAVLYQSLVPVYTSMWLVVFVAGLISVFGQLGDLVESAFKRHYGMKDSGGLLPGHGGILDRFDSILLIFPILHLFHLI